MISWRHWFTHKKPRKPMLRVTFEEGEGGRHRWFARQRGLEGRIVYSCFPNSFDSEQQAWEDAQWACGASVTLVCEHEDLELYAAPRDFSD